jgi:hypothetical protein
MAGQLARLTWCASAFLLAALPAPAASDSAAAPITDLSHLLKQEQLSQPDAVAAWLRQHAKTADRKTAKFAFDLGVKSEKVHYWGRAAKSYGESSVFFPTPTALTRYADVLLRERATVRAREREVGYAAVDLGRALSLYRSAVAADDELKELRTAERGQLDADIACLVDHLDKAAASSTAPKAMTARQEGTCRPLSLYKPQ